MSVERKMTISETEIKAIFKKWIDDSNSVRDYDYPQQCVNYFIKLYNEMLPPGDE